MKNSSTSAIFKTRVVLLIAYSLAGCKKYTIPPAPAYLLSKDGLAYIQFNVGKYFIYKDSVANKTDSVVVTQSMFQTYTGVYSDTHTTYTGQKYTIVETDISLFRSVCKSTNDSLRTSLFWNWRLQSFHDLQLISQKYIIVNP